MKIVIVQGALLPVPPVLGGAVEKMWFALSKEFVLKGHSVVYISRTYPGFKDYEVLDQVEHIRAKGATGSKSRLFNFWSDFKYAYRVCRKIPKDADVIITSTFWLPILLPSHFKQKNIIDVQRMPKGQMKWYTKSARLRANSTTVELAIKSEINSKYAAKVCMIPNPLPFSTMDEIQIQDKEKAILYVGRLHPEKGVELLIQAFVQLECKDWKLIIVGPHEYSAGGGGEGYLNYLKNLSKDIECEFVGPIFNINQLNQYYKKSTIFVYPSLAEKGETFGLAPLEAMAWGCIPVVSDLDCFKDFIENNINGFIFNHRIADSIFDLVQVLNKIIFNKELQESIFIKSQSVRNTHSLSTIADQFIAEFNEVKMLNI